MTEVARQRAAKARSVKGTHQAICQAMALRMHQPWSYDLRAGAVREEAQAQTQAHKQESRMHAGGLPW